MHRLNSVHLLLLCGDGQMRVFDSVAEVFLELGTACPTDACSSISDEAFGMHGSRYRVQQRLDHREMLEQVEAAGEDELLALADSVSSPAQVLSAAWLHGLPGTLKSAGSWQRCAG